MLGAFYYQGAEKHIDLEKSSKLNAKFEVGTVSANALEAFERACSSVPIEQKEYGGWNCQSWTIEALDELRKVDGVDIWYDNNAIKNWLKEAE